MRTIRQLALMAAALFLLAACQDVPSATLMPTAVPPGSVAAGGASPVPGAGPTVTRAPTFTPTPTATPSPTPTPTPIPQVLLEAARREQAQGDYGAAMGAFREVAAASDVSEAEGRAALVGMAEVQLRQGAFADAEASLTAFLAHYPEAPETAKATFWLAQARQGQMDWAGSIAAFEAYLALDDTLTTYVSDMIADSYLAMGDHAAAFAAYELALTGAATAEKVIAIRERLAQAYLAAGDTDAAIAQYDAISAISDDEEVLARMDYLAGYALVISGRAEEGYARYLRAVQSYPDAYDSYLALIELVDAGYPVDDFDRGLVDYYADACIPSISAFYRHIESDPYGHPADGHLYVARCYADLGNYPAALMELDVLIETHPGDPLWGDGWLEKAEFQAEAGAWQAAIETYLTLADQYPADPAAPSALWGAAALWEYYEFWAEAGELYRRLAADYPAHEDAPEGMLMAGLMASRGGDVEAAVADWKAVVDTYPESEWAAPALLWLMQSGSEEALVYQAQAAALPPDSYYAIRAADLVSGVLPFEPPSHIVWYEDEAEWSILSSPGAPRPATQVEAESWLRGWTGSDPELDLAVLRPAITADSRWERGRLLWELWLTQEALVELNGLRAAVAEDPLSSYQLAVAFRELGLYRSSILAASTVIRLSPAATPLDAPHFIGRLAYPAYYRELVQAAADDYGLDPLLLFSMIRQESLFESQARSHAAAQGLMQVIPSTGEYIAESLGWPDYRNEDLYKPYVSIQFGAYYLAEQLALFDNSPYVALSAYNGGPGNASGWYALAPDDPDFYLEIITLSEPRLYIQQIYTHYTYYRELYGEP
jgi:soluble lytic murein transglycosylase